MSNIQGLGSLAALTATMGGASALPAKEEGDFSQKLATSLEQLAQGKDRAAESGVVQRGIGYVMPMLLGQDASPMGVLLFSLLLSQYDFADAADPAGGKAMETLTQKAAQASPETLAAIQAAAQAYKQAGAQALAESASSVTEQSVQDYQVNDAAKRNRAIIDSFHVETNSKYQPKADATYCNVFASDVTKALGAQVPRYVDGETGAPAEGSKNGVALNANRMNDWLNGVGSQYGWVKVSAQEAQNLVNQGAVGVASWKNPNGHGHIQVVSPSKDGLYDPQQGVTIAQAGRKLVNYGYMEDIYKTSVLKDIDYFVNLG